ncbi:MAG: UDP-N-acetylglucosamine 2-epimerase (non-hydrolyzing) [Acidobacteria bacterium]|nr:MAG: UDP-N-acetylglucosamine 2-epimerase (non-hydrolyzing) [Acidobacteriota bacterium]
MTKKRILSVVGARPNFMKIAPILLELDRRYGRFDSKLVHTGQHYDQAMSDVFFHELGMKEPDYNLSVGSGSHATQTAEIMKRFEEVCRLEKPDLVIVGGDVNSTLACSLTAVKMLIPVAHVEAGLRSFDRTMPEEINRIVTDSISDLLFTTETSGNCHLKAEGIPEEKIHLVGNTMIDSLVRFSAELSRNGGRPRVNALADAGFYLATIHRPANVDEPEQLAKVVDILLSASDGLPVLFVAHPRTRERLRQFGRDERFIEIQGEIGEVRRGLVYLLPPLSYLDFLYTMSRATAVLTDSGGIQEETTFLGIPCLTLRENTERPITVEVGSNEIVGLDRNRILACLKSISAGRWKKTAVPPLWDGKAAGRIVDILEGW